MKNRVMIVGGVGAGKSTLVHALLGKESAVSKTQALVYDNWIVDTPGEYIENPMYYKTIMATSLEVTHVIYLQDATSNRSIFPPQFSLGIPKIQIGVITKIDDEAANIEQAIMLLKNVMIKGPIVMTSSLKNIGIEFIAPLIKLSSDGEILGYVQKQKHRNLIYIQ